MPKKSERRKISAKITEEIRRDGRNVAALKLRVAGYTMDEIAQSLGFRNPSAVHKAIKAARARIPPQDTRELRDLMHERLEAAIRPIMLGVEVGDMKSVDRLVKVSQRMARLLGLDLQSGAPTEIPVGRLTVAEPLEADDDDDDE